ncbi:hypothetical protein G6F68_020039 [Rhizopus microsporus]|nr:hypothetical protein G6F68_020039 [Rhizopus microsporus]
MASAQQPATSTGALSEASSSTPEPYCIVLCTLTLRSANPSSSTLFDSPSFSFSTSTTHPTIQPVRASFTSHVSTLSAATSLTTIHADASS